VPEKCILLVNPHNAFREAIAMKLNQEPGLEVVWQAGSLEEAHGVHLDGIDLAIVDPLLLGGDDGMVLVREVSVANPNASALVLTSSLDPAVRERAFRAGAVEVLTTSANGEEVINVIRRFAGG
jgi:two-component system, NarL family, response regulator DevR